MNIAIPAMFLVILILPGIIFRRKFREGTWQPKTPPRKKSIAQQVVEGLVAAAVLHGLWLTLATKIAFFRSPDLDVAASLLLLGSLDGGAETLHQRLAASLGPATLYFLSLYGFSYAGGVAVHAIVRRWRLDVFLSFFRFDNPWYYILTGDRYGVPDQSASIFDVVTDGKKSFRRWTKLYRDAQDDTVAVFVTVQAIQEIAGKAYLYRGILEEWYFAKNGNLDRLILIDAARRELDEDPDAEADENPKPYLEDPRYYQLDTDYCILEMRHLQNLSINWIRVSTQESEG